MIIYRNSKGGFIDDASNGIIARKVQEAFESNNIGHNNDSEYKAWHNSLMFMCNALRDNEISDDVQIAIEYQIPLTSKRVDFLLAGQNSNGQPHVVIVELKQWEDCTPTQRKDVVESYTGGAKRIVCHPSYQAYSYAKIIENFNEEIYKEKIELEPCAYLHNFLEKNRNHIDNELYKEAIELAPVFLSEDVVKLKKYIKEYVVRKDDTDLLMKIEYGKLKPSKALQDSLVSMIKGNKEFYLIDEQKVAYETVRKLVEKVTSKSSNPVTNNGKHVVIVTGGPGTGKSVIAIQLLVDIINKGYSACYVTKNAAPRNVYFEKLRQQKYKDEYIKRLFKASDSFWNAATNSFDCLIIDEAHRLRKKSSMYHGENQIKELINAAKVSIFFIDEDQKVTTKDIGSVDEIKKWADYYNAKIYSGDELNLVSQFRCNGSDGYLNFLDNLLGLKETANTSFDFDYDFRVFDSPRLMKEALKETNDINNKSRMIAGYCYEWISRDNPNGEDYDIVLNDGFRAKWNFGNSVFAIDPNSFEQVGCIHTTQGLEFEYCGIIIGQDLRYENGKVITDQSKEAKSDKSSGIKGCKDKMFADKLIRNTYKTLLSRGQKGCFVYCEDEALREYLKKMTRK